MDIIYVDNRAESRTCSICKEHKDASQYRVVKRRRKNDILISLHSWCTPCLKRKQKGYKAKKKKQTSEYFRKYYSENKEKIKAAVTQHRERGRVPVVYRLDFENGTYWYGSTVQYKERLARHAYLIAHNEHSARVLAHCGNGRFTASIVGVYEFESEAREVELELLRQHVGKERCLNTLRQAVVMCPDLG